MKLVPLGDRVVLKQIVAEETTKSGIVLPGQSKEKPQQAEIIAVGPGGTVDGKEVYKTSIKKDQIYQIPEENGTNVMQIKDGKVTMKKADCKDQICADHKAIEKSGETIVCLPHKVVIEIRSEDGKEQELDGVTQ